MMCVNECPAGAISGERTVNVTVASRKLEWGELDIAKCSAVYQAGTPEYSPFMTEEVKRAVTELLETRRHTTPHDIWTFIKNNIPYSTRAGESYHHPACVGGARGCIRACMIHLEETHRISNLFKAKFRKREPWRLT